jgi:hypothetical protein
LVATNSKILVNNLDVIRAIDGVEVASLEALRNEMNSKNPGEPVTVDVLRITETFDAGSKNTSAQDLELVITAEQLLPDVTSSGQQLLEDIWHERRIELAMEQHRMFDIRRQGRAGELLRAQGKDFVDGTHDLYPIPRSELDLNPELAQNPGY